ncbi:hypothetical protein DMR_08930 [Solidesulfovibrio magneticus RS-1]|uniref:Uncharacterized protein n=1 Tax=Solidesulfovibrio magneticus (strain ATCC 700980 / DSM 13731 / RS-1) TaxID=573370 RepID=C4XK29_SOLM1|nr:hypothetical protein DMR_08930 [Solidesulfovibrio magneticus RS-1]
MGFGYSFHIGVTPSKYWHWAGAGSPFVFGEWVGICPGGFGNSPGRGGGREPGGCPGQGLGAGQGRRASASSVRQELPWLMKRASIWMVTVFLAKYRENWIVNTVSAYWGFLIACFSTKVVGKSRMFSF